MLNKIEYFKGFSEYTEGVERWSDVSDSYLFGVRETGVVGAEDLESDTGVAGKKEKEYFRYEFSRLISTREVKQNFVDTYMEYHGYDLSAQLKVMSSSSESMKLEMERVTADAYYYAAGLDPHGDRVDQMKRIKRNEIQRYDISPEVNSFALMGKQMWLAKDTRVGLVNSINIEKAAGKEVTTLWFDGVRYEIPIGQALQMLAALEIYALECYNVTHKHLAEVDKLTSVETIKTYSYKTGYPDKLNFDSREIRVC